MTKRTKKELLEVAKTLEIVGRHDMSVDDLREAVEAAEKADPTEGGNYVYTSPFRDRIYGYAKVNEEVYKTLPPQAKKIFDYMRESGFEGRGKTIVENAVREGFLKTTQDEATLFAFYARKLEDAGIKLTNR